MAKTLVIVESPTKARTLERFLGDRYTVKSSFGHVRDLPDSASQVPDAIKKKQCRRILHRLYRYRRSAVLWKKVQTGLSAGRVQSVAVRLIVDREEERLAFRAAKYADLNAQFTADGRTFPGTLTRLGEERVASGKD